MIAMLRAVPLWLWLVIGVAAIFGLTIVQLENTQAQLVITKDELGQSIRQVDSLKSTLQLQRQLYKDTQAVSDEYDAKINALQSDKDKLSRDLADGSLRVSVNATCVRPARNSSTISQPDAAAPRLTDSAQRDYLDLRSGIQRQAAQITGLQTYIKTVCLKGQVSQ
jgi:prophage endopeptidase